MTIKSLSTIYGEVKFSILKSLWLWTLICISCFYAPEALSLQNSLLAGLISFLSICIGHSVGLHRGFIHETYQAKPSLRFILLFLSTLTGLGGPATWIRIHALRDYWQNKIDGPKYFFYDQNILTDFFWNLHCSFHAKDNTALKRLPPKLLHDPIVLFFQKTWIPLNAVFALVIYLGLGFNAFVIVFCLRVLITILSHWGIGYAIHKWGQQPYKIDGAKESGTNIWLFGILAFGEGYHNNHHKFPNSANFGLKPHEFDLGFAAIKAMSFLNLVSNVKEEKI